MVKIERSESSARQADRGRALAEGRRYAALPDLVDPRRGLVVRAMAIEGLTVPRISAAAKHSGGYAALLQTLELGSRGVELTRGERLALATAAIS